VTTCNGIGFINGSGIPLTVAIGCLHLPLTAANRLDMGKWQREAGKYALGVFAIFVVTVMLFGHVPFYLPQNSI
ncbi:H+/citrate symporter, partial [Lacticaseibacillus rhamnosus MTCC 5462]